MQDALFSELSGDGVPFKPVQARVLNVHSFHPSPCPSPSTP